MAQSTLYIHIGTPKTGTTALQGFLAKNRKTLQEHGAVFPDFGLVYKGVAKNRNAHFLVATKDPFHAKEMGVCMKILKQQAALYPKILISDESIWTFYGHPDVETAPFWKKLKEMLDGMDLDLKVIVYLRRQDQYAFSYYAQKIKEAEEIRDVQFSLQALYSGDEEPVTVVSGNEIMMVKTADGTYLFG